MPTRSKMLPFLCMPSPCHPSCWAALQCTILPYAPSSHSGLPFIPAVSSPHSCRWIPSAGRKFTATHATSREFAAMQPRVANTGQKETCDSSRTTAPFYIPPEPRWLSRSLLMPPAKQTLSS